MTDKRAKDILDFLARRKEWLYMSMREKRWGDNHGFVVYLESKTIATPIWIEDLRRTPDMIVEYADKPSWRKVLNDLMKFANDSNVVKLTDGTRKVFLEHGISLESILIEMDLKDIRR